MVVIIHLYMNTPFQSLFLLYNLYFCRPNRKRNCFFGSGTFISISNDNNGRNCFDKTISVVVTKCHQRTIGRLSLIFKRKYLTPFNTLLRMNCFI